MKPIVKLIIAILLLLCLADMPFGFYQLVHFAATAAFVYLSYDYFKTNQDLKGVIFALLAVLFQPFFKIAVARLTNEDTAQFTYQEVWVMHDVQLDLDGNTIKTSSREYSWEQMCDRFAIDEKGNHLVKGFQRHILKEDE